MANSSENTIEILLIDNDDEYFRLLREGLKTTRLQNFALTHADRLSAGLKYSTDKHFDVLLTELQLPDSQGYDTFATLNYVTNDTPILIITELDDEQIALQTVRAGAQDYLVKGQFQTASLVRSIYYAIERHRTKEKYQRITLIDELTGLYNRRGFYYLARQHIKLVNRSKGDLLLILADLDNMKFINDNFGHLEGDAALRTIAKILKKTFRSTDILSRLDGDEFTVIAFGASEQAAEVIKDRLQRNLNAYNHKNGHYHLSLSMGVAKYNPREDMTLEDLVAQADKNLYDDKRGKQSLPQNDNDASKAN